MMMIDDDVRMVIDVYSDYDNSDDDDDDDDEWWMFDDSWIMIKIK